MDPPVSFDNFSANIQKLQRVQSTVQYQCEKIKTAHKPSQLVEVVENLMTFTRKIKEEDTIKINHTRSSEYMTIRTNLYKYHFLLSGLQYIIMTQKKFVRNSTLNIGLSIVNPTLIKTNVDNIIETLNTFTEKLVTLLDTFKTLDGDHNLAQFLQFLDMEVSEGNTVEQQNEEKLKFALDVMNTLCLVVNCDIQYVVINYTLKENFSGSNITLNNTYIFDKHVNKIHTWFSKLNDLCFNTAKVLGGTWLAYYQYYIQKLNMQHCYLNQKLSLQPPSQ